MRTLPLKLIKELADMTPPQLRTRYRRAMKEPPANSKAGNTMSRGRLIVEILKYEFEAVSICAEEKEEDQCLEPADEWEPH